MLRFVWLGLDAIHIKVEAVPLAAVMLVLLSSCLRDRRDWYSSKGKRAFPNNGR